MIVCGQISHKFYVKILCIYILTFTRRNLIVCDIRAGAVMSTATPVRGLILWTHLDRQC